MSDLGIIGRAERIDFLDYGIANVPAKTDTGADLSSVWATDITEQSDGLHCKLFGPGSSLYTGNTIVFPSSSYTITRIANSFGQKEIRYKVKIRIKVKDRTIRATFTLADRSQKTYPVLLGRRLLKGKFLVDVAQGDPLIKLEEQRTKKLAKELSSYTPERKSE